MGVRIRTLHCKRIAKMSGLSFVQDTNSLLRPALEVIPLIGRNSKIRHQFPAGPGAY